MADHFYCPIVKCQWNVNGYIAHLVFAKPSSNYWVSGTYEWNIRRHEWKKATYQNQILYFDPTMDVISQRIPDFSRFVNQIVHLEIIADPRLSDISSFYLLQPPFTSLNPTQELFLYFNLNCARKIESHKLKVIFLYLFNIITWNICYFYITELARNLV